MKKSLFTYAILFHGGKRGTEIVKDITSVLATDENEVKIIAAREIPQKMMDELEEIEILINRYSPVPVYTASYNGTGYCGTTLTTTNAFAAR